MGLLTGRINNKLERSNLIYEHALNLEPVPLNEGLNEWWLLRLLPKVLTLLRLSVNFFQLRLTKKLKIKVARTYLYARWLCF